MIAKTQKTLAHFASCNENGFDHARRKVCQCTENNSTISDTVHRRINLLADDIKIQLIDRVKGSPYYAIQLDESTDVANVAQLLIFIRYRYENDICEDLLFCQGLEGRTTAVKQFLMQLIPFLNSMTESGNIVYLCVQTAQMH